MLQDYRAGLLGVLQIPGKKFKNGTVCGTGLADSVSEHFDVLEVIPK